MPKAFGELCASGKERSAVSSKCSGMVDLKSSELVRHLRTKFLFFKLESREEL